MLEFAILGLLKERAMHGYELRKQLRGDFGVLANLSFGSLYPALARLESSGAIRSVGTADEPRFDSVVPLTGSLGGERAATVARRATQRVAQTLGRTGTRAKKVYEITPAGEALFCRLLEAPANGDDDRGFTVRLAFARYLSPAARIRLLERRRHELSAQLEYANANLAQPGRARDRYERALAEHARDTLANDLSFVERLLEHEESTEGRSEPARATRQPRTTVESGVSDGAALVHDGGISA